MVTDFVSLLSLENIQGELTCHVHVGQSIGWPDFGKISGKTPGLS